VEVVIASEDPRTPDVRALLERHLRFSHEVTPAGHVHALDIEQLVDASVTFYTAREGGVLLGVGALRELDPAHGEVKSMHTAAAARDKGVGRAVLEHLVATARARGYDRISLETGTYDAFAPARSLYVAAGFVTCPPFGEYTDNPHSVCMTLLLADT
jgi:putative acetyltransferase